MVGSMGSASGWRGRVRGGVRGEYGTKYKSFLRKERWESTFGMKDFAKTKSR